MLVLGMSCIGLLLPPYQTADFGFVLLAFGSVDSGPTLFAMGGAALGPFLSLRSFSQLSSSLLVFGAQISILAFLALRTAGNSIIFAFRVVLFSFGARSGTLKECICIRSLSH